MQKMFSTQIRLVFNYPYSRKTIQKKKFVARQKVQITHETRSTVILSFPLLHKYTKTLLRNTFKFIFLVLRLSHSGLLFSINLKHCFMFHNMHLRVRDLVRHAGCDMICVERGRQRRQRNAMTYFIIFCVYNINWANWCVLESGVR